MKKLLSIFVPLSSVFFVSCVTTPKEEASPGLNAEEIAALIPAHIKDRQGWATDILHAIEATKKSATAERACAVIAIVEQESGFKEDPPVKDLPKIVREGILKKFKSLGVFAEPALALILAGKAPGHNVTFGERIKKLKTERELDLFFRDIATAYRDRFPGPYTITSLISKLMGKGYLEDLNPVTTAGSMQVKVDFAQHLDTTERRGNNAVRDWLYTRAGGLEAGTARLLAYEASYGDIIFRFADYNSGMYSSRNAAFQGMIADLTGQKLTLDGDILAYEKGDIKDIKTQTVTALLSFAGKQQISEWTVNRDVKKEKTQNFEETTSWNEVRSTWQKKTGKTPPYARMPEVLISSPKLTTLRSTKWFASNVKKRYEACRTR